MAAPRRADAHWMALPAALAVLALWRWPPLAPLLAAFNLFVTFVHEAAHSLAAILTGGSVLAFQVFADGSGVATTRGGNLLLIALAGYAGTAFFGASLFVLANRVPWPRVIVLLTGLVLLLSGLFAGAQGRALALALIAGALLLLLAWRAGRRVNLLALNLLAMLCALQVLRDLALLTLAGADVPSDATLLASLTGLPALFWALAWTLASLLMMAAAFWLGVWRPLRKARWSA